MKNALLRKSGMWLTVVFVAFVVSSSVFAGGEGRSERERDEMNERRRDRMSKRGREGKNEYGRRFNRDNMKNARGKMSMLMSRLSDEEKKELEELRQNDKEAFRDEIRELVKKYKRQFAQEQKEIKTLAKKIRKAKNGAEKNELIAKLRSNLRKRFNSRMAMNRKNYEQSAKRLKDLKKKLDAREKNADEIIDRKFKDLTEDPDLKW
jgi:hypothetical protein